MVQVYFRPEPRAFIFVATSSNQNATALILGTHRGHHGGSRTSTAASSAHRAVIELVSTAEIPELLSLRKVHANAFGCLGLINVGHDLFVGVVDRATAVGEVRPGEPVMRIASVAFHCLNKDVWDGLPFEGLGGGEGAFEARGPPGSSYDSVTSQPGAALGSTGAGTIIEHPCASMRKHLANGTFYFAQDGSFDISRRLDKRIRMKATRRKPPAPPPKLISPTMETPQFLPSSLEASQKPESNGKDTLEPDSATFDSRFVWNTYMLEPLREYRSRLDESERNLLDRQNVLLPLIQGYVGSAQIGASATIALISRLSWKRAGTRFATRGIDDDGNAANFAESETLYTYGGTTMSYCQVRGSVPLFWEQQGLQAFNARIQVTRSRAASQPAFDRHFSDLLSEYGHVHALNLLGTRDAERVLTSAYAEHMRSSEAVEIYLATLSKEDDVRKHESDDLDCIGLTNFDFHSSARVNGGLDGVKAELIRLGPFQRKRDAFQFTLVDASGACTAKQNGVFRVNCLDCLDRTNVVQDILSQSSLQLCVERAALPDAGSALWSHHRTLWAENGDALSRIYAGTGALNSNFTRTGVGKKTLGGLLSDAAKSASRLYINNFQDKSKQNVIDALLGNVANQKPVSIFDPVHDAVNAELDERLDEFSTVKEICLFTGTWNLAGRGPSGENLEPFLFPMSDIEPDILAIGLQEVVPLTPQQILLTDPDKLRVWERAIASAVGQRRSGSLLEEKGARYIPLRSEQLVGTALIILIKDTLLPFVRLVEAGTKKTGLKGMSGNKGGIAIRMNIYDTSFCFVTAHFAAGKSNVDERHADFMTISRGLSFHSGRDIQGAQHVFWLGDFNYRIDGTNEMIRPLCESGDLDELAAHDQLIKARASRHVFHGYQEGKLVFLPTYKYDFRSQRYDTSEKMRVPAWTDRILYKSRFPFAAQLINYNRAELLTSDHRPVFAIFHADARQYDTEKRNALRRDLILKYKASLHAGTGAGSLGQSLYTSEEEDDYDDQSSSAYLDDDDEGYATDELPPPSTDDGTQNWWERALSSGEEDEKVQEDNQSDSSNEERRKDLNPFHRSSIGKGRRRTAQYARQAPQTSSSRSGPASSSSHHERSPLPIAPATSTSAEEDASHLRASPSQSVPERNTKPQSPNVARRQPPKPPTSTTSRKPTPDEHTPASSASQRSSPVAPTERSTSATSRKLGPPAIPSKPSHIAMRNAEGGDRSTAEDSSLPSALQPPKIPLRPTLGPRSQSYQSTKSQRSLLDDSD